ncbi:MAG: DUF637 domain-containing protein [Sulfurospirillum cavolei]|nr:DUF637 domain-containing protein [Sulfurospirillum cavolei]
MQYTSLTGYTNVGDLGYGSVVNKIAQGTVNAGIKTAITGDSFKENLINEAAQNVYMYVGDLSLSAGWKEGSLNKVILHSAVGAGVVIGTPWATFPEAQGIGAGGSLGNIWRDVEYNNAINEKLENQVKDMEKNKHE